jgi:hypothetical protein
VWLANASVAASTSPDVAAGSLAHRIHAAAAPVNPRLSTPDSRVVRPRRQSAKRPGGVARSAVRRAAQCSPGVERPGRRVHGQASARAHRPGTRRLLGGRRKSVPIDTERAWLRLRRFLRDAAEPSPEMLVSAPCRPSAAASRPWARRCWVPQRGRESHCQRWRSVRWSRWAACAGRRSRRWFGPGRSGHRCRGW